MENFRHLSFHDMDTAVDRLGVGHFEGFSTQKFDETILKNVDDELQPGEIDAI